MPTEGLLLNLGCGTKTSAHPHVVNVDWSPMLRIRQSRLLRPFAGLLLTGERRRRFDALPENLLVHDLSRGIPFPDRSVAAVYHSHVLEHIDRERAPAFFAEVRRVLRPGGVHRVAVPDLEKMARDYLAAVATADEGRAGAEDVERRIADMIEQMVRRHAAGTSRQRGLRRRVETWLLGDARERGETHQWMYDRHTLVHQLEAAGFERVQLREWGESALQGWAELELEVDESGQEYRAGSLYVEASEPE